MLSSSKLVEIEDELIEGRDEILAILHELQYKAEMPHEDKANLTTKARGILEDCWINMVRMKVRIKDASCEDISNGNENIPITHVNWTALLICCKVAIQYAHLAVIVFLKIQKKE
jgi:hypothetical protein